MKTEEDETEMLEGRGKEREPLQCAKKSKKTLTVLIAFSNRSSEHFQHRSKEKSLNESGKRGARAPCTCKVVCFFLNILC